MSSYIGLNLLKSHNVNHLKNLNAPIRNADTQVEVEKLKWTKTILKLLCTMKIDHDFCSKVNFFSRTGGFLLKYVPVVLGAKKGKFSKY